MPKYFKILKKNDAGELVSCHGGSMVWNIDVPNSVTGEIIPCRNGLHLCRTQDISRWLVNDGFICLVDVDESEMVVEYNKVVVRSATISSAHSMSNTMLKILRCDLVERRLLINLRRGLKQDAKSFAVLRGVRMYLRGEANPDELCAAAEAAYAAADAAAAAAAAAYAAAYATDAADAATDAAYAATDAAYAAAYAAADAATDATDAADAATDAAYAATEAAEAATEAAEAAYAATEAAYAAERNWAGRRILFLVGLTDVEPKVNRGFEDLVIPS